MAAALTLWGMNDTPCCPKLASICETAALVVAALGLAGSLHLSIGLGLQACPLCIYERTFLMGVVAVLGLGGYVPALWKSGAAPWLALPLAVAGLGVAAFHVWLDMSEFMVCPLGIAGLGSAPLQSLLSYVLLFALLLITLFGPVTPADRGPAVARVLIAVALGAVLAYASCASGKGFPPPARPVEELRAEKASVQLKTCTPVKQGN